MGRIVLSSQLAAEAGLDVSIATTAPRSNIAPASYMFRADVTQNYSFTPASGNPAPDWIDTNFLLATYEWNVSDVETGLARRIDEYGSANLVRENREYGERCMHLYETPGAHFVYLRVIFPDGRWGSASTTVNITDPETAFTSNQTVVVSADGVFTGAPANGGATHQFTDIRAAWDFLETLNEPKARILVNPASVPSYSPVTWPLDLETSNFQTVDEVYCGSWTKGTEVVINFTGEIASLFTCKGDGSSTFVLKFEDWHPVATEWDPTIERNSVDGSTAACIRSWVGDETTSEIILNNTRCTGHRVMIGANNDDPGHLLHVNNHESINPADFIVLFPKLNGRIAITQTKYKPPTTNRTGGWGKEDRAQNWHNFTRCAGDLVYIAKNYIFANHGWGTTMNAPLRLGRNNPTFMRAIVAGNVLIGNCVFELDDDQGPHNERLCRFMHNYCPLQPTVNTAAAASHGMVAADNNLILQHDTPDKGGGSKWSGRAPFKFGSYRVATWSDGTTSLNEPILAWGNTLIDLPAAAPGAQDGVGSGSMFYDGDGNNQGEFLNMEEAFNAVHQPNAPSPIDLGLNTTSLGWDSPQGGLHWGWAGINNFALPGTYQPGESFIIPFSSFLKEETGVALSESDFTDIDRVLSRHRFRGDIEDNEDVVIQVDVPSAGQVTVTNNTGVPWAQGAVLRVRFFPPPYSSGDQIIHELAAPVANGGTVVVNNPDGLTLNPTGHIRLNTIDQWYQEADESVATFEVVAGQGIRITNVTSGNTAQGWLVGDEYEVRVCLGDNGYFEPEFAHPTGTIASYRPLAAIAPTGSEREALTPVVDYEFNPRPGSNHPDVAGGTPTRGYLNV